MNRTESPSNRLNDFCFAVVLATAAACTGWIAAAGAHAESLPPLTAAAAPVQLERVVIAGHRDGTTVALVTPVELPRVVITSRRAGTRHSDV